MIVKSEDRLDWYMDKIRYDLERLGSNNFTGNVEFKVNFRNGIIMNMNNTLNKSLKMPGDSYD